LKIKSCPECGKAPKWDEWELDLTRSPYSKQPIILYALVCSGPDHICHGSYRSKRRDAIIDWNLSMTRRECKMNPNEKGGEDL
jgi:hypothetical protein